MSNYGKSVLKIDRENPNLNPIEHQVGIIGSPNDTHHSLLHVGVWFKSDKGTPHIEQATTGARHLERKSNTFQINSR